MKTGETRRPIDTLKSARQYFFYQILPSREFIGLSRLLQVASNANISEPDWIFELSDLEFSEAQSLISFALSAIQIQDVKASCQPYGHHGRKPRSPLKEVRSEH